MTSRHKLVLSAQGALKSRKGGMRPRRTRSASLNSLWCVFCALLIWLASCTTSIFAFVAELHPTLGKVYGANPLSFGSCWWNLWLKTREDLWRTTPLCSSQQRSTSSKGGSRPHNPARAPWLHPRRIRVSWTSEIRSCQSSVGSRRLPGMASKDWSLKKLEGRRP